MKTKEITVYVTSNANTTPGARGYTVHFSDPDPGWTGPRTLSNGMAVPVKVQIPDNWELWSSKYDEQFLWCGETPHVLHWMPDKGVMIATVPGTSREEQIRKGWATYLQSQTREEIGA